jgi:hypothetical protein
MESRQSRNSQAIRRRRIAEPFGGRDYSVLLKSSRRQHGVSIDLPDNNCQALLRKKVEIPKKNEGTGLDLPVQGLYRSNYRIAAQSKSLA